MNKIISRMLVLGLLVSFVQAQAPSRDIDKDAHKASKDVKNEPKDKAANANAGKATSVLGVKEAARIGDEMPDGVTSDYGQRHETVAPPSAKADKGAKGVSKGSQNIGPSARVTGDRQLAGHTDGSASPSGKKKSRGALGRVFSRIFGGGGEKVDGGGKSGAAQQPKAGDGQDRPSGNQGHQEPKGQKGPAAAKQQDDGGGR